MPREKFDLILVSTLLFSLSLPCICAASDEHASSLRCSLSALSVLPLDSGPSVDAWVSPYSSTDCLPSSLSADILSLFAIGKLNGADLSVIVVASLAEKEKARSVDVLVGAWGVSKASFFI